MPRDAIARAAESALTDPARLQYTESAGWGPLREVLAARESVRLGRPVPLSEIFVTHGSQQALSLLGEVLLDPGALVVVEDPAYVGALQVFRAAGARIEAIALMPRGCGSTRSRSCWPAVSVPRWCTPSATSTIRAESR